MDTFMAILDSVRDAAVIVLAVWLGWFARQQIKVKDEQIKTLQVENNWLRQLQGSELADSGRLYTTPRIQPSTWAMVRSSDSSAGLKNIASEPFMSARRSQDAAA